MRRIQRVDGTWKTDEIDPAHAGRMRRAAERAAKDLPADLHLVYAESRSENRAILIDAQTHAAAEDEAGRLAATRYHGPVPEPEPHEVARALHTLRYAGVNPLRPAEVQRAFGAHVAAEHVPHDEGDPEYYQRILASGSPVPHALREIYERRAKP